MDKVLNFEEKPISDNEEDNEETSEVDEMLEDNEMTAEEIAYYNSITANMKTFDISDLEFQHKKKKKRKEKKESNNKSIFELIEESKPKTWKSKRADNQRMKDGKVKLEKRKFNPRPLPLNWDEENGCEKKVNVIQNQTLPSIVSFPTLGKSNTKDEKSENKVEPKLPVIKTKPKVASIWSKMLKKK